mmetsp:Transcript_10928/g.25964  ORF Transcript_10928/g.25964 Transcript_10928/m.25964 type:complete len:297 (+) Transcript_10928:147-1037(+)
MPSKGILKRQGVASGGSSLFNALQKERGRSERRSLPCTRAPILGRRGGGRLRAATCDIRLSLAHVEAAEGSDQGLRAAFGVRRRGSRGPRRRSLAEPLQRGLLAVLLEPGDEHRLRRRHGGAPPRDHEEALPAPVPVLDLHVGAAVVADGLDAPPLLPNDDADRLLREQEVRLGGGVRRGAVPGVLHQEGRARGAGKPLLGEEEGLGRVREGDLIRAVVVVLEHLRRDQGHGAELRLPRPCDVDGALAETHGLVVGADCELRPGVVHERVYGRAAAADDPTAESVRDNHGDLAHFA